MAASIHNPATAARARRLILTASRLACALVAAALIATHPLPAQQPQSITATFTGSFTGTTKPQPQASPRAVAVSASQPVVQFPSTIVGVATASAPTVTATFLVSGYTGSFTPTATLHYGLSYSAAALTCTDNGNNTETCSIPLTFSPLYPGGRPDALFLMDGTTRLATLLLYGIGEAPFAMLQPGVVTNPINDGAYYYNMVVDERGIAYVYARSTIYSITPAGVVTQLPISNPSVNSNSSLAIDGAGVLYFGSPAYGGPFITYDTVQGSMGSVPFPTGDPFFYAIVPGNTGNLYEIDFDNASLYKVPPTGSAARIPINPTMTQSYALAVDSNEDVFIGGYAINELTPSGTQAQVYSNGISGGLSVDAASTLYTGVPGVYGVAELPASNYSTYLSAIDTGTGEKLGSALGPDGTLYVGTTGYVDKLDRTRGFIDWVSNNGQTPNPQTISVYNGGNQPLTLASIAVSGPGYALQTSSNSPCSNGVVVAPGALCRILVTSTPPHAGTLTGSVTITSNSLNSTVTQTVAMTGYVSGIYVTATPNPLDFGYQSASTTKNITVTNSSAGSNSVGYGSSVVINGSISSSNPAFTASPGTCASALASGGPGCQINVTFTPTALAAYSGTISWTEQIDGGPSQQISVGVTATSVPPVANIAVNETIHATDIPTVLPSALVQVNETIHLADTPIIPPLASIVVNEALHLADTIATATSPIVIITEAVHIADAPATATIANVVLNEVIHLTDAPTILPPAAVVVNEALHLADTIATATSPIVIITEAIHVADTPAFLLPVSVIVKEVLHLADTLTATAPPVVVVNEAIHVADTPAFLLPASVAVDETIHFVDAPATLPSAAVVINETIHTVDTPVFLLPASVIINEALHVTDTLLASAPPVVIVNEAIHLLDVPATLPSAAVVINETIHTIDASTDLLPPSVVVNEALHLADSVGTATSPIVIVNEAIHIADTPLFLLPASVVINEALHVTDIPAPLPSAQVIVSELLRVTDQLVIPASVAIMVNEVLTTQDTLAVAIPRVTPLLSLASSQTTAFVQNAVTFTASLTPGMPTGSITFYDNAAPLGTATLVSGAAAFTTTALTTGQHTITAVYSGDPNFFPASSPALTQTILDFSLASTSASESLVSISPGGSATWQFNIAPTGATTFPAPVTFDLAGLPSGATYSVNPATIPAGSGATSVVVTIKLPTQAAALNAITLSPIALALLIFPVLRRTRLRRVLPLILLFAAVAPILSGCGRSHIYVVTVTAHSESAQRSTTFMLDVQ